MSRVLIIILLLTVISSIFGSGNREETRTKKKRKGDVYLFSEVKGQLTFKGEPLSGIKITRTYPKPGVTDYITEETYSDENGYFSFDEAIGNLGIMRFLPHEAVIDQTVKAEYQNDEYTLWYTCKRNYDRLGEFRYFDNDPILHSDLEEGYNNGYIQLNCDLTNKEEIIQNIDNHVWFFSIKDFNTPYETTLKELTKTVVEREDEYFAQVSNYFRDNPNYFDSITDGTEHYTEEELELLKPYIGATVESVERVEFTDFMKLYYFTDDYHTDSMRLNLHGEVIVNILLTEGRELQARVWISDTTFNVSSDSITLLSQDYNFRINAYNIDPDVID